jgi:hypothetical protein
VANRQGFRCGEPQGRQVLPAGDGGLVQAVASVVISSGPAGSPAAVVTVAMMAGSSGSVVIA